LLPFHRILYLCLKFKKVIAKYKLHTDSIKHHFKSKAVFETKDIVDFYKQFEKNVKPTTINWRVYTLVQEGVLQRIGRGKFKLGEGRKFIPEISSVTKSIFKKLKAEFPYANFCVWNTSVVNEFMQHQPGRYFLLVETNKETANSVFYFLREIKKPVFIDPTGDILEKYIVNEKEAVIIKSLISEAPTQNINEVETATIEKMLVDIFCDDVIFSAQQGAEKRTIFKEAFTKYTINQSKMLRYADRRRKKEELKQFVITISNLWQQ
jgi:DNA-binding Lrp family transcriptional regulator